MRTIKAPVTGGVKAAAPRAPGAGFKSVYGHGLGVVTAPAAAPARGAMPVAPGKSAGTAHPPIPTKW